MRGYLADGVAITQRKRLLETPLDAGSERAAGMIDLKQSTTAQQMRKTRLMVSVHEAAVWGPAIACEHACEVSAENRRGVHEPAAGSNRVDRGIGGGKRPEPVQRPRDLPGGGRRQRVSA